MIRTGFFVALFAVGSSANAATLIVQTVSGMSGIALPSGDQLGGTDIQGVITNTAAGDASVEFSSQMSVPGGTTSGFVSGNVATGEMKASVQVSPGTYYGGIEGVSVYFAEGSATSQATISETFIASDSGNVRFDLAYDGFWNISGQPYLFFNASGLDSGFFNPFWQIQGSLTLAGSGVLSGENFFFTNTSDPNNGVVSGVLSAIGYVLAGQEYGISMSLLTQISQGASGGIDFSNTATLSYSTDPGVTLSFADSRFLTEDPAPAVIPLPASGLLLAGAMIFLLGRRRRA